MTVPDTLNDGARRMSRWRPGRRSPALARTADGLEHAVRATVAAAVVAAIVAACGGTTPVEAGPGAIDPLREGPCREPGPTPLPAGPFTVTVTTPDSARAGTGLTFAITVRNTSDRPATLLTGLADQTFNFLVRRPDGAVLWNRLVAYNGGFIADVAVLRTVAPGEEVRYAATWDQRDPSGRAVGAGRYEAFGVLFTGLADGQPGGCYRSAPRPLVLSR